MSYSVSPAFSNSVPLRLSAYTGTPKRSGHTRCGATCNSDEEIARALALGVDVLISDLPQKALRMRDK